MTALDLALGGVVRAVRHADAVLFPEQTVYLDEMVECEPTGRFCIDFLARHQAFLHIVVLIRQTPPFPIVAQRDGQTQGACLCSMIAMKPSEGKH